MQLDDAGPRDELPREGPIDMRMDPSCGETALELIDRLNDDESRSSPACYGEDAARRWSCAGHGSGRAAAARRRRIARVPVRAAGRGIAVRVDPGDANVFQALRIAVN